MAAACCEAGQKRGGGARPGITEEGALAPAELEAGDAVRQETCPGGDVVARECSPADSLEKAMSVSGKLGGVAGVLAGAIICTCSCVVTMSTLVGDGHASGTHAEVAACLSVADRRLLEVHAERRLWRRMTQSGVKTDGGRTLRPSPRTATEWLAAAAWPGRVRSRRPTRTG